MYKKLFISQFSSMTELLILILKMNNEAFHKSINYETDT